VEIAACRDVITSDEALYMMQQLERFDLRYKRMNTKYAAYHFNANCHMCGNVEGYDGVDKALSRLDKHDGYGAVMEVSHVWVWRDGKKVRMMFDEFINEGEQS
jgi:hypothetical protein